MLAISAEQARATAALLDAYRPRAVEPGAGSVDAERRLDATIFAAREPSAGQAPRHVGLRGCAHHHDHRKQEIFRS